MLIFLNLRHYLSLLKKDVFALLHAPPEFNPDVFVNPQKYSQPLKIDKIVADLKVSRQGVEFYKKKILTNKKIEPIIVVKHPRKESYAVLDGHHRFHAYRELGKKSIDCALAGDFSRVNYYLTKNGYFQPNVEITENFRHPLKKLHNNLKEFLEEFSNQ